MIYYGICVISSLVYSYPLILSFYYIPGWFSSIKSPEKKEADASIAKQQRTERNRRPKKKKTATSAGGRASVRSATTVGRAARSSAQAPSQTSTQRRATRKSSYTSGNMGGDDIVSTKKKGGNKSSKKKGGKKSCKVEDSVGEGMYCIVLCVYIYIYMFILFIQCSNQTLFINHLQKRRCLRIRNRQDHQQYCKLITLHDGQQY